MANVITQMALFCDEAGQETDRFLAVDGLVISSESASRVRDDTQRHFRRLGINSEMKRSKTRRGDVAECQELFYYIFQLIEDEVFRFHCLLGGGDLITTCSN